MYKKIIYSSILLLFIGCGESNVEKIESHEASPSGIKVTEGAVDTEVKDKKSKTNSGQFYYSYNKEKNSSKYNSEDSKTKTTIDAYLNIRSPYEKVRITMMIKRLSKDYIIKCSPCHDDYANGVIGPSLLDKDDEFIYKKIMAFKTGEKKNPLMKELVSQIDDDKLKNIAKEISNFNKEIRKMRRGK
jgi:cytochrome c553